MSGPQGAIGPPGEKVSVFIIVEHKAIIINNQWKCFTELPLWSLHLKKKNDTLTCPVLFWDQVWIKEFNAIIMTFCMSS